MSSILLRIELASKGRFKICRTAAEIRACFAKGVIAAVLPMEGAEAVDDELYGLDVLYEAALRTLGSAWKS